MFIFGGDPGPVVGVALVGLSDPDDGPIKLRLVAALQTTTSGLAVVLAGVVGHEPAVALERYVVGSRAGRSATAQAGAAARWSFTVIDEWATRQGFPTYARSASEVKPWATDERLDAAGLLDLTKGMRHARDAARHALFCAVKTYGLPDPLSRRGREA